MVQAARQVQRGSGKSSEGSKGLGGFSAESGYVQNGSKKGFSAKPSQVQQGSEEGSKKDFDRFRCRAKSALIGF